MAPFHEPYMVLSKNGSIYIENAFMIVRKQHVSDNHKRRLEIISMMLKEMRQANGRNQDGYIDDGLTRMSLPLNLLEIDLK